MVRFCSSPKRTLKSRVASVAMTGLAALTIVGIVTPVAAKSSREAKRQEFIESRVPGAPLMAIVSLSDQRITVYDADGWIMRAPVSSGQTGYETPAGVYSVIQKEAEHYSNLYDDASMPFMQRITWSGIALHAGPLPGYAASHGCVRMPYEFAKRLFELTKIGMRVVVARHEVGPMEIGYPVPLKPKSGRLEALKSLVVAKSAEAEAAAKKADQARLIAVKRASEASRSVMALRVADGAKYRAEAHLSNVENALETAHSPEAIELAEQAKVKALAKLAEARAQLEAASADAQPRAEATARAREEVKAAESERVAALEAASEATRKMSPVSIFISRKTQRLYVRQSFQPVFESPVTIGEPDQQIGTHIYTALDATKDDADLRWTAVSMYGTPNGDEDASSARMHRGGNGSAHSVAKDASAAKTALDRITIPQDALDRLSELVSPGSSLIVSDEGMSSETSNGTDFVIVMSGEPQGGIKIRHRVPEADASYNRGYDRSFRRSPYYERSPYYGRLPYSGRPYGGSFFSW
jgi:L,D-transpeptidase catalytic domain